MSSPTRFAPPASRWSPSPRCTASASWTWPRVRRILAGDTTPEPAPARGKPPELCPACPYHTVYGTLAEARLHRRRRHRLLHAGRAAAVRGDGHVRGDGRLDRRGPGAAPRPAAGRGAPRRLDHRRLHLRPLRHQRPGRDGLQPAADRPRRHRAGQRHDGDDRPAGASRHRPPLDHGPTNQLSIEGVATRDRHRQRDRHRRLTPSPRGSSACCSNAWPRPSCRSSSPAGPASWPRPTSAGGSSRRPSFGPGGRAGGRSTHAERRAMTADRAGSRAPRSPTSSSPASAARASSRPRTSWPTPRCGPAWTSRRRRSTA